MLVVLFDSVCRLRLRLVVVMVANSKMSEFLLVVVDDTFKVVASDCWE